MKLLPLFVAVLAAGFSTTVSAGPGDAARSPVLTGLSKPSLKQRASNGQRLEQAGDFRAALNEYQAAIAELPVDDLKPIVPLDDDPHAFLNRASAELDAARVMPRVPGHDPKAIAALLSRADTHFSTVLTIVENRPVSPANQTVSLRMKATLGRAYVGLLSGNVTKARADLQIASTQPALEAPQVRGGLAGLDKKTAEQLPQERNKPDALVKLGVEVVKAFLPKYAGIAIAVGDVAEAFKK